jgi:hypothetical protein
MLLVLGSVRILRSSRGPLSRYAHAVTCCTTVQRDLRARLHGVLVGLLLTLAASLAGASALSGPAAATDATPPAAEAQAWAPFDGGPDAVCADGSPVHYLEHVADPTRVVLYFEGGGACFSADTCAFDGPDKSYISSSLATPELMAQRGGMFDLADPRNPLADFSFVYVPYCTGDVHLGDVERAYAPGLTVEHRGHPDAMVALDHLAQAYPDARQIVVTGSSGGSVPTPLYAGLVADDFPDARIVSVADSSGAFPDDPVVNTVVGRLWNTQASVPDWPETRDVGLADWSVPGLFRYAGRHAPQVVFARFDYAHDAVQAFYAGLVGIEGDDMETLIDGNAAGIEAAGVPVASYVAPGDAHTILGSPELYTLTVAGVPFLDWLTRLVAGDTPPDVHCLDCDGQ